MRRIGAPDFATPNGKTVRKPLVASQARAVPKDAMLVSFDQVTKTFGEKLAVDCIGFDIPAGQICGLLGPNGAGKTTLFRLLMGILKASSGTIRIDGLDAFDDRVATKRLIGFLPDEPVFYSYLSAREILELSAAMHGLDRALATTRVEELAQRLGLTPDLDRYAEDFSRGMKKKLGLLLAMVHEPRLLVLDEPTNGLDVESTRIFYDMIQEAAATGVTILFSTHLMDQVAKLCTHAVIINKGTLTDKGALADLQSRYGESDLESLFLKLTSQPLQK